MLAVKSQYRILSEPGKRSTYDQGRAMRRMVRWFDDGDWQGALGAFGKTVAPIVKEVATDIAFPLAKG
jgi:hypothetical protein